MVGLCINGRTIQMWGARHGSFFELELGLVEGVGLPVSGDDVVLDDMGAALAGEADGEGGLDRLLGVDPPDGAPRRLHGQELVGALGLDVNANDVAVAGGVLDEQRQVHVAGSLLDMEGDLGVGRVLALDTAELHGELPGLAQLVLIALLGHGAECLAGEVEVVGGDVLVVLVGDLDVYGLVGALGWLLALDLEAGAAAQAVLEDGLVAARRHAVEGSLVHVLVPARAAVVVRRRTARVAAVERGHRLQPLVAVARRDVGARLVADGAHRAAHHRRQQHGHRRELRLTR
jgi:hypothetical protein